MRLINEFIIYNRNLSTKEDFKNIFLALKYCLNNTFCLQQDSTAEQGDLQIT